jgi:hypothetical protein
MAVRPPLTALQVMQDAPVIPVIVLHDVAHAVPMARALVAGGIRMLEVTLRTPAGAGLHGSHRARRARGRGRRRHRAQCGRRAGGRHGRRAFAVSPGYTPASVRPVATWPAAAARCGHRQRDPDVPGGRADRTQVLPGHAGRRQRHAQGLGWARSPTSVSVRPAASPRPMRPSCWRCPMWCVSAAPGWCRPMRWRRVTGRASRNWPTRPEPSRIGAGQPIGKSASRS